MSQTAAAASQETKPIAKPTDVFMVAFGGPEAGCCKTFDPCPGEAWCFVSGIFGHNPDRKARIDEVAAHYKALGGYSQFNDRTRRQAAALEAELQRRGTRLAVHVGFHHWRPYAREVIATMGAVSKEPRSMLVMVMAPHQSSVSWDHYLRIVGEGVQQAGPNAPTIAGVVDPWWNLDGFAVAIADRVRAAAKQAGFDLSAPDTAVLFSAHSIPAAVARNAPYCKQFEESAKLAAQKLGVASHQLCYQSSPTGAGIPWTGPSVEDAIAGLAKAGKKRVVAAAIGFLCDNVEVLYDLGVEGEHAAKAHGMGFARAESVHDHPAFIGMLADQVEAKLKAL